MLLLFYVLLAAVMIHRTRRAQEGRLWVHPLNEERDTSGLWASRMTNLRMYPDRFFQYFRMMPESFDYILNLVRLDITKEIYPNLKGCIVTISSYTFNYSDCSRGSADFTHTVCVMGVRNLMRKQCMKRWTSILSQPRPL